MLHRQTQVLLLVVAVTCCGSSLAFSSRPSRRRQQQPALQSQMSDKLEAAAIKRFTVGYDKLCKNCPTRLVPRKDTLVEMIVGLPPEEREELLATVQQRLEEQQTASEMEEKVGLHTPMEVYQFQLGNKVEEPVKKVGMNGVDDTKRKVKEKQKSGTEDREKRIQKAMSKMEKARSKLAKSETKLVRANHLLDVTIALLKKRNFDDVEDDEEIDELRCMTRPELKLQRLKYLEIQKKCERTRAKCRLKRYAASMDLARFKEVETSPK